MRAKLHHYPLLLSIANARFALWVPGVRGNRGVRAGHLSGAHLLWQVLAGGVADAGPAGAVVPPAPQGAVGAGGAGVSLAGGDEGPAGSGGPLGRRLRSARTTCSPTVLAVPQLRVSARWISCLARGEH